MTGGNTGMTKRGAVAEYKKVRKDNNKWQKRQEEGITNTKERRSENEEKKEGRIMRKA